MVASAVNKQPTYAAPPKPLPNGPDVQPLSQVTVLFRKKLSANVTEAFTNGAALLTAKGCHASAPPTLPAVLATNEQLDTKSSITLGSSVSANDSTQPTDEENGG